MSDTHSPPFPVRRRLRRAGYDYSAAGAYFVTACTFERRPYFGQVDAGVMRATLLGRVVEGAWHRAAERWQGVEIDSICVMPDHVHAIVWLHDSPRRVVSLGDVVRDAKSSSTVEARRTCAAVGRALWQRGYFDRIIRDQRELDTVRRYLAENPARWRT